MPVRIWPSAPHECIADLEKVMLDTLKNADLLRKAGFDDQQARAVVELQKRAVDKGSLATKPDIADLKARMDEMNRQSNWRFGILLTLVVPIFVKLFLG